MKKIFTFFIIASFVLGCASRERIEEYKENLGGDSVMNYKDNTGANADSDYIYIDSTEMPDSSIK